jgi:dTDP-4-amino-4,6-dideoxygalactose transaminase
MNKQVPAILGGQPIFDHNIKIVRPVVPRLAEISAELQASLASGTLTKGHHLRIFEERVAEHLGVKHAVAVSSCTTGLMLTYMALGLRGHAVVPSFTFMATVSALVLAGVQPVFADVDQATMNLDPTATEAALTRETTAIVAVHNFGNPAAIDALQALADRHGLSLIFDAAQGFGATYLNEPVGAQGAAQVFSLTPTKLVVAGEGGIVATNSAALAARVRIGREYGNDGHYDSAFAGLNARMPEFNALLARHSLHRLEQAASQRNLIAEYYRTRLGRLPGLSFQQVERGQRSSYNYFAIVVDEQLFGLNRDELALALVAEQIETRKYYDPPVHRQTAYQQYSATATDLVNTDLLAARVLCLPIWSNMMGEVAAAICLAVERIFAAAKEIKPKLTEEKFVVANTSEL